MEKVLAKFPLPCKFSKYGCGVKLEQSKLEAHEQTCNCKPDSCPITGCVEKLSGKQIMEHLYNTHICKDVYYSEGIIRIPDVSQIVAEAQTCSEMLRHSNPNFIFYWNFSFELK